MGYGKLAIVSRFERLLVPSRLKVLFALIFGCLALSACASTDHDEDAHHHDKLHISSAWVKAADEGMTAAFASLHNNTGSTVVITAISTDASSSSELHETVTEADHGSHMKEAAAGFTIGAAENMLLEPGGNHFMLMDLTRPLLPGEEISFTVHFDDDTTQEFTAVVKEFDGAHETYGDHGEHH